MISENHLRQYDCTPNIIIKMFLLLWAFQITSTLFWSSMVSPYHYISIHSVFHFRSLCDHPASLPHFWLKFPIFSVSFCCLLPQTQAQSGCSQWRFVPKKEENYSVCIIKFKSGLLAHIRLFLFFFTFSCNLFSTNSKVY